MTIATPSFSTENAPAPVLAYADADLRFKSDDTAWGIAAYVMAMLTAVYSVVCVFGMFTAQGWGPLAWLVYGFIGNWIGAGLGLLFALVGCIQRSRRRGRAAHALWLNAMVAAVPFTLIAVPVLMLDGSTVTPDLNAVTAWAGALFGIIAGVILGCWYHRETWLGGYASWPRRMLRLGHVSFFGLAGINLAYAMTLSVLGGPTPPATCSAALAASNLLMPLTCIIVAFRPDWRNLFAVPVICTSLGVGGMLWTRLIGFWA